MNKPSSRYTKWVEKELLRRGIDLSKYTLGTREIFPGSIFYRYALLSDQTCCIEIGGATYKGHVVQYSMSIR